jgi:hypothetical protein
MGMGEHRIVRSVLGVPSLPWTVDQYEQMRRSSRQRMIAVVSAIGAFACT